VQPALGVGDHLDRVAGAADRETGRLGGFDQRVDLGLVGDQHLDVAADREAQVAVGELVGELTDLADRVDVHLALGAEAHRPHLGAVLGDVVQDAGTRAVVPLPLPVLLAHRRVEVRGDVDHATLDGRTRFVGFCLCHASVSSVTAC
jgi:hypothetical protein